MVRLKTFLTFLLFLTSFSVILFGIKLSILSNGMSIVEEHKEISKEGNVVRLSLKPEPKLVFAIPPVERMDFLNDDTIKVYSDTTLNDILFLYFTRSFSWGAYHLLDLSGGFQSVAVVSAKESFKGDVSLCWGVFQNLSTKGQVSFLSSREVSEKSETLRSIDLGEMEFKEGWSEFTLLNLPTTWKKLSLLETYGDVNDQPLSAVAASEEPLHTDIPPGTVYVFDNGAFAGTVNLNGMTKGQKLEIIYGSDYDIRGSRVTLKEERAGSYRRRTVKLYVRNYGKETRNVRVIEHIPSDARVLGSDMDFERIAADKIAFSFNLEGEKTITFEYTVEFEQR